MTYGGRCAVCTNSASGGDNIFFLLTFYFCLLSFYLLPFTLLFTQEPAQELWHMVGCNLCSTSSSGGDNKGEKWEKCCKLVACLVTPWHSHPLPIVCTCPVSTDIVQTLISQEWADGIAGGHQRPSKTMQYQAMGKKKYLHLYQLCRL